MKNVFNPENLKNVMDDHGFYLYREDDGTPIEQIQPYEIVFDYEGERYYCFVDGINSNEALGLFFSSFQNLTMDNLVEILEI